MTFMEDMRKMAEDMDEEEREEFLAMAEEIDREEKFIIIIKIGSHKD